MCQLCVCYYHGYCVFIFPCIHVCFYWNKIWRLLYNLDTKIEKKECNHLLNFPDICSSENRRVS